MSSNQAAGTIGRITPRGTVTEFALPRAGSDALGLTSGPDGNLWFTEAEGNRMVNRIGRMTPHGQVTEYALSPG